MSIPHHEAFLKARGIAAGTPNPDPLYAGEAWVLGAMCALHGEGTIPGVQEHARDLNVAGQLSALAERGLVERWCAEPGQLPMLPPLTDDGQTLAQLLRIDALDAFLDGLAALGATVPPRQTLGKAVRMRVSLPGMLANFDRELMTLDAGLGAVPDEERVIRFANTCDFELAEEARGRLEGSAFMLREFVRHVRVTRSRFVAADTNAEALAACRELFDLYVDDD